MAGFSLTEALVGSDPPAYRRATQSPFLDLAARGQVPPALLGRWLANDRLYIHAYIRGIGRMLAALELPGTTAMPDPPAVKLLDWLAGALANIRREERFFVDAARRHGIAVDLPAGSDGRVRDEAKLEGLRRFEGLFGELAPVAGGALVPWLECVVVFWGTERCYLDAWTWARGRLEEKDGAADADGGALREEFIPNWTSKEFVEFVDDLGKILDEAVGEVVQKHGEGVKEEIMQRALPKWRELLAAEEAFWPAIHD